MVLAAHTISVAQRLQPKRHSQLVQHFDKWVGVREEVSFYNAPFPYIYVCTDFHMTTAR